MVTRRQANSGSSTPVWHLLPCRLSQPRRSLSLSSCLRPGARVVCPDQCAEAETFDARVFGDRPLPPQTLWSVVGGLRHQSPQRLPDSSMRTLHHSDRHICRDGRGRMALRARSARPLAHLTATSSADRSSGLRSGAPQNKVYVARGERSMDGLPRSVVSLPRSIRASSARTSTYSAPRKASPQSSGIGGLSESIAP